MRVAHVAIASIVWLAMVVSGRSDGPTPATAGPGGVQSLDAVRSLLREAAASRSATVRIPPGVYRGRPERGSAIHLEISNVRNFTLLADGVTIVCEKLTRALEIRRCENLMIRGLTVDYDPLPFTQGTVVAVATDGSFVDVKLDAGYPRRPYSRVDLVDARTRTRKRGMPFLWGAKARMQGADTVRVSREGIGRAAAVGDLVSLSTGPEQGGIPHAIVIADSDRTTLQNVTVNAAPGFGILDAGGEGGTHLVGCKVVPGPVPPGATQPRLLSSSWDAVQHKICRKGPLVEECEIRDAGDDSWSVQASDYVVLDRAGKRVIVAPRDPYSNNLEVGDRLRKMGDAKTAVIRTRRELPIAEVALPADVREKLRHAGPWTFWKLGSRCLELTLDDASFFPAGTSVYSPDRRCNGFVFRKNRVRSPGRILVQAGSGAIEDNDLRAGHGIVACPEVPGTAAACIGRLVIRGNTLAGQRYFCPAPWSPQAGAISCVARGAGNKLRGGVVFGDLVIADNLLRDINGLSIVVSSARAVSISGNRMIQTHRTEPDATGRQFGIDQSAAIWISRCGTVTLKGNVVEDPGPFLRRALVLGGGIGAVQGGDSGVTLVRKK